MAISFGIMIIVLIPLQLLVLIAKDSVSSYPGGLLLLIVLMKFCGKSMNCLLLPCVLRVL